MMEEEMERDRSKKHVMDDCRDGCYAMATVSFPEVQPAGLTGWVFGLDGFHRVQYIYTQWWHIFFQVRVIYRLRRHLRCCAHIHLAKRNLVPKLLRAYRRKLESELFSMVKFLHFSDNLVEKSLDCKGTVVGLWAWI
jgi:hypothetical protein